MNQILYLNPASKEINIETSLLCHPCHITIESFEGKTIMSKNLNKSMVIFPINGLKGS